MMDETQYSITRWAEETFGPSPTISPARIAARANEEMAELIRKTTESTIGHEDEMLEECADVVIVLYRLASVLGGDLHHKINAKMKENRLREWEHGHHK